MFVFFGSNATSVYYYSIRKHYSAELMHGSSSLSVTKVTLKTYGRCMLRQLTEDRQIEAPPINLTATQLNQYFSTIGSLTVSHLQTSHTIDAKEQILWKGSNCACIFNFSDVQLDVIRAYL